jgi:PHD/YefM family antitoxin component YafN of YafNO toxin-antitoxin module
MARVSYVGQRVVIERKGRPMMALISIADLRRLETLDQAASATSARRQAALALAAAARAAIRVERDGVPLPDSGETLAQLREERAHEPADLR